MLKPLVLTVSGKLCPVEVVFRSDREIWILKIPALNCVVAGVVKR